jgi:hypothetical protein
MSRFPERRMASLLRRRRRSRTWEHARSGIKHPPVLSELPQRELDHFGDSRFSA